MDDVIIRHWKHGDDEGIFKLFDRTARWVSNDVYHKKFRDKGLKPEGIILAEKNGLIIGHLMGTRSKIIYEGKQLIFGGIGQVMVDENYRGHGIGKAMLERIIQYHKDGKCRGIILWTQTDRVPAYPMYEKFGFKPVANRAFYHIPIKMSESSLSVELYISDFKDQTEEIRREWMKRSFPVGIANMKPGTDRCQVIRNGQGIVGYIHIGNRDGIPLLSQGVTLLESASEVFDALLEYLTKNEHKEAIWQTCVGSVWEEEFHKRGFQDSRITTDVRMCLSIGSPIDTHGLRPEFDGCSTW